MSPSLPSGELTMEASDWRTRLPSDARSKIVNKIMETLKKHLPFSGSEAISELNRIAARFEEDVFATASSQTDYLRKISMKMLTMEIKAQDTAGSSSSIPAANNSTPLDSGHLMDNDNSRPSLPNGEPAMNTGDWRTQLPPDSRQKNVDKITETLKKHVPNSGEEGINELMRIAASLEELSLNTAINQADYFHKISFKMMTMEEGD